MARNQTTAAALIPPRPTLASLRKTGATCKACDLWKRGTQTVFGEGKPDAKVMFVGEQPGDREDIVGPSVCGRGRKNWIRRWRKRASIGPKFTYQCSKAFQMGSAGAEANVESTKSLAILKSMRAVPGWTLRSR